MHEMSEDVLESVRLLNNLEQGSMYTNHFSLESLPFENVPDPLYFFDQGDYSRVLSRMLDSIKAGRGLMVLAGPIGTGKTTLTQKLMVSVPDKTTIIWLSEPPDTSDELLLFLSQELGIKPEVAGRVFLLRDIKEHLLKLHDEGNSCLLMIDEVHKISDDVLESVRLLNNLEQGSIKLIQIFLIGQEEFLAKLARPELESFKQRIAWLEVIGKMTPSQTQEYILHRLKVAGSQSSIFTDDAIEAIVVAAQGTPRLINTLCDRALRVSYEANKTFVDLESIKQAGDDIGLGSEIFWWLWNREQEIKLKAEMEASSLENNPSLARSDSKGRESELINKDLSVDTRWDISQWSVFTLMDELMDKTIGRISDSPIVQLFISILLFAASLWFYMVNTKV